MLEVELQKETNSKEPLYQEVIRAILRCKGTIEKTLPDGQIIKELCLNADFGTRGRDKNHFSLPWLLECTNCGARCYPHTSYAFEEQSQKIAQELLQSIFIDHQKFSSLGNSYHFLASSISQFAQSFRDHIHETIQRWDTILLNSGVWNQNNLGGVLNALPTLDLPFQLNLGVLTKAHSQFHPHSQLLGQASSELIWPFPEDKSGTITIDPSFLATLKGQTTAGELDYSKMIVLDETFLTIGGIKYCLIVAVSREGKLLSWSLGRTRKTEDLNKVFLEALERYPFPGVIVTDNFSGYHAMVKLYPYPIIHVAHIHKYPHNKVIIYQRFHFPEENRVVEVQLGIRTDLFVTSGEKTVFYETKEEPLVEEKKKRGRPKGRKNRPKEIIKKEKTEKAKRQKKKRGPKNVFRSRKFFKVTVNLESKSFSMENTTNSFLHDRFFFLLYTLFILFQGQHITSNYVENFFSQLKFVLNRGRRVDVNKFIDDIQIFIISNFDRIHNTKTLLELIDQYVIEHPPPPGFAYRKFFRNAFIPYLL